MRNYFLSNESAGGPRLSAVPRQWRVVIGGIINVYVLAFYQYSVLIGLYVCYQKIITAILSPLFEVF